MRAYVIASGVPSRFSGGNSSSGRIFSKRDFISAVVRVLGSSQYYPERDACEDLRVVSHVINAVNVGLHEMAVGRVVRIYAISTKDSGRQILWLIIRVQVNEIR